MYQSGTEGVKVRQPFVYKVKSIDKKAQFIALILKVIIRRLYSEVIVWPSWIGYSEGSFARGDKAGNDVASPLSRVCFSFQIIPSTRYKGIMDSTSPMVLFNIACMGQPKFYFFDPIYYNTPNFYFLI